MVMLIYVYAMDARIKYKGKYAFFIKLVIYEVNSPKKLNFSGRRALLL